LGAVPACRRGSNKPAAPSTISNNESDAEIAKREAQALLDQGKDLYKNNDDKEAADVFEKAIRLNPDLADAHFWLGLTYNALERKPEADEALKKAIELYKKVVQADPRDADAYFNLGEAYSERHLDEEAARAFKQVVHLRPDDEEAYYQLGKALTRLAQYTEAAAAFQKALEIDPDDYRVTEALDTAREGVQRIREGKKHAEDELKKQQANANANGNANGNSNTRSNPKRGPAKPW